MSRTSFIDHEWELLSSPYRRYEDNKDQFVDPVMDEDFDDGWGDEDEEEIEDEDEDEDWDDEDEDEDWDDEDEDEPDLDYTTIDEDE